MKLNWRNPFFILGLVLLWRLALLIFTAQPIPANDAFIFDGGMANWLKARDVPGLLPREREPGHGRREAGPQVDR